MLFSNGILYSFGSVAVYTTVHNIGEQDRHFYYCRGGQKIFLLEGGHKKLKQRGSGGSHAKIFMAVLALFGEELVPGCRRKPVKIFFFWANFFYIFSKKKKNVASSKSYRGSKAISEGGGSFWILEGGHKKIFRRGRTPLTPPPPWTGIQSLHHDSV